MHAALQEAARHGTSVSSTLESTFSWGEWLGAALGALVLVLCGGLCWLVQRWRIRQRALVCKVLARERKRVSQDIHDGIGSQIVYAMSLLQPSDPAQRQALMALDECLLGLRLTVDGLSASDESLAERLGRLRQRIEPAMQRRGLALHWDVQWDEAPQEPPLSGRRAALLMMVAQEALSNVMQHAQARQVWLYWSSDVSQRSWLLRIADDGTGALPCTQHGKGLGNMQARAAAAGGSCQVHVLPGGGCEVQVQVPWDSPLWKRRFDRRAGERGLWRWNRSGTRSGR